MRQKSLILAGIVLFTLTVGGSPGAAFADGPAASRAAIGGGLAAEKPFSFPPGLERYAEGLYQTYSEHAHGAILFEVETIARGKLRTLGERPIGDLLETPEYLVMATHFAREIRKPHFTPKTFGLPGLRYSPQDFEEAGYPVDGGTYRVLRVGVAIGDKIKTHQALELCWLSQGHCVLVEPAVIHLESVVGNLLQAAADGWAPKVTVKKLFRTKTASMGCVLTGEEGLTVKTITYPARSVKYVDEMGNTVVTKQLGKQVVEVACAGATEAACVADPGGSADNSTCNAVDPYDCSDDEDHGEGTSTDNKSGKAVSETKATHLPQNGTQAVGTVADSGMITVHVDWTLNGAEDANGQPLQKSCSWGALPPPP